MAGNEDPSISLNGSDLAAMEAQPVLGLGLVMDSHFEDAAMTTPIKGKKSTIAVQTDPPPETTNCGIQVKEDFGPPLCDERTYSVKLEKKGWSKLGIDVDMFDSRTVLPVTAIRGGLAEQWNKANPSVPLQAGDSIVEVNGCRGSAPKMLEMCKKDKVLNLTLRACLSKDHLVADIEKLVTMRNCGPALVRLCLRDFGSKFGSNAGGSTAAAPELSNISAKYCPSLISNADLWALAGNVAIRLMGGPHIDTRFGRVDESSAESVPFPDSDSLRWLLSAADMSDQDVVALSGVKCVSERQTDDMWTEQFGFDNSYFEELLQTTYTSESGSWEGTPQYRGPTTRAILLESDVALIRDPKYKTFVETYAADQGAFLSKFAESWSKLQERGWSNLRRKL